MARGGAVLDLLGEGMDAGRVPCALGGEEAGCLDHERRDEVKGVVGVPGPAARLNIAPPARR